MHPKVHNNTRAEVFSYLLIDLSAGVYLYAVAIKFLEGCIGCNMGTRIHRNEQQGYRVSALSRLLDRTILFENNLEVSTLS